MNKEKISVNLEKLIVIGDRVLIRPAPAQERTKVGLYLPQTVREKDEVITGDIVKTGPGLPLADPANIRDERFAGALPAHGSAGGRPRLVSAQGRHRDTIRGRTLPDCPPKRDPAANPG